MSFLSVTDSIIEKYVSFLLKLKPSIRIRIAEKLRNSTTEASKPNNECQNLFGCWIDERSSDKIIADMKEIHSKKNDIRFE